MDLDRWQHGMGARRCKSRGAAMVEFVLAIPLLATLIGLTFFLGWAMRNQQGVIVSARYEAWQAGASVDADLNPMFMDNKAGSVSVAGGSGTDATRQELVAQAGGFGTGAYGLAYEAMFGSDTFPAGRSVTVSANFPTSVAIWSYFQGNIAKLHERDGESWRRGEASPLSALRDQFFIDLDQQLQNAPSQSKALAERIRQLYLQEW